MDSALRPMSTSEVLDRTFFLYRKNFVLFAGLGAVLPALVMVMQLGFAALGFSMQNPELSKRPEKFLPLLVGYFLCYGIVSVIGQAVATGATVDAVSRLHLGYPATMVESYKRVFSRFFTILFIVVTVYACVFLAMFVGEFAAIMAVGVAVAGMGRGSVALMIVSFVIGFVVVLAGLAGGAYLYLRWCLAVPASLVEGSGIGRSLGRSFSLAKGSILRLLLIYFLWFVIAIGLGLVFAIPAQLLAVTLMGKHFLLALTIQQIGGFIAGVLAAPIVPIAASLVYFDQRVRKEAFDLQLMMQAVEQAQPQPAASAAPTSTAPIG